MNRMTLLYQLDDLFEKCKTCEKPQDKVEIRCKDCQVYSQIRWIGENLGRKKQMAKISLEEYQDYKAKGLTDKQIAEKKEINHQYLSQLKKKWGIRPQLGANTTEKKPCEGKCNRNDKTGEYERLIKELKQQIESSKSDHKERIDWVVKEYEDKLADKQLDNDSIKRDYLLSREENHRLQQTVYDNSYVIENQKNRLGKIAKENEKLEEENKLLKGLIRLWA